MYTCRNYSINANKIRGLDIFMGTACPQINFTIKLSQITIFGTYSKRSHEKDSQPGEAKQMVELL